MVSSAKTPDEYIKSLPDDRRDGVEALRQVILKKLPKGFDEIMGYGMLGYVVPHSIYPAGYHCNPKLPLPFINLASQKNSINFYHMGMYADANLLAWFQNEFPKHSNKKLDMGKSCIRFKSAGDIPLKLMGQLVKKMTVKNWIALYEKSFTKKVK